MVVALIFMPKAFFKGSSVWLFRRLSKPKRNLQHVPCKFVNRRCSKSPVLPGVSVMQRKFCMFVILAASADTFCHCKSARSWQMELLLYKVITLLVASTANAIAYVERRGFSPLLGCKSRTHLSNFVIRLHGSTMPTINANCSTWF